jgi:phosphate ABC transporter permease subunit PstA
LFQIFSKNEFKRSSGEGKRIMSVLKRLQILPKFVIIRFTKQKLTTKNLLGGTSFIFSVGIVLLGFFSASGSFYIGDFGVRLIFILFSILFFALLFYSIIVEKKRRQVIGMIGFFILCILFAYFVPLLPPATGLQRFELSASILKFLLTAILFVITGVIGASLALKPVYNFSQRANELSAYFLLCFAMLLIVYPLIIIIGNIFINGAGSITWQFLTEDVIKHGEYGGVNHALIGTFIIIGGTAAIALPLGVASAIYLIEYAKEGLIVRIIRIAADILQGIPSIVFGLFGLAVFVPLFGISILSGILVMSFMTLPIIIRSSEEALLCVPRILREGSYALGATKWQTIRRVVIPPSLPGIITGGVLGLGRAAGETAPIIFTASIFISRELPTSLFSPVQSLSYHLYVISKYIGAYPVEQNAWATALLLIGIVLGMNAIAMIIREKYRVEF